MQELLYEFCMSYSFMKMHGYYAKEVRYFEESFVLLCFQNLAQLDFNIYCGLGKQQSIHEY